jgi:hypothetical protein
MERGEVDGPSVGERLLRTYVDGWKEHDPAKILGTLDSDCVVVESRGAVYRGSARVGEWFDAWFGEGNTIEAWDITALLVTADTAAMEWRFTCTWHGRPASFEGASVARFSNAGIAYLREYQTVAELYDWKGTWRD